MKKLMNTLLTAALGLAFSACNNKSSSSSSDATTTAVSSCSSGYVYHSTYGCLAQSTCPTGYGLYNNQCILATTTTSCSSGYVYSATYGCLLQSGCATGYALYNNSCIYVGSTTISCPTGYTISNNTCVLSSSVSSTCQGSCAAGAVQTVYGCLPQGSCGSCYGASGRYCLGGAPTGYLWYMNPY